VRLCRGAAAALPALLLGLCFGCAHGRRPSTAGSPLERLTPQARLEAIRRAQVWTPVDVAAMDLQAGPQGEKALAPDQPVTCAFVDRKLGGHSPKFACASSSGVELKVRYGADNGEVYAGVAATRLFWALGFGANPTYPVRVTCGGCPADPWRDGKPAPEPVVFDPATVERKVSGKTMEGPEQEGWKWAELDQVDEARGGAPRAQRDALKLLAALVQHVDSRARQQRLVCLPGGVAEGREAECSRPFMMVADLGVTFGRAHLLSRSLNRIASMNFEHWSSVPVWKDPDRCVAKLQRSFSGTLDDPHISEAGRKFLADLLVQLSARQIRDLFEVARVDRRPRHPGPAPPTRAPKNGPGPSSASATRSSTTPARSEAGVSSGLTNRFAGGAPRVGLREWAPRHRPLEPDLVRTSGGKRPRGAGP